MEKISREIAEAEVKKWLDKKKVFQTTREAYEPHSNLLADAICEGALIYNEDEGTWKHNLLFPLDSGKITELNYIARLNDIVLRPYLKGVAGDDPDARVNAHIAALTNTAKGIIAGLDSADKKIASAIAIFFL
jgi:hypothetical protein